MKIADIIPFDRRHAGNHICGAEYEWLRWPALDSPHNAELNLREKTFGINHDIQNLVLHGVIYNMIEPVAGSFPVLDRSGNLMFRMNRSLIEELERRIDDSFSKP